MKFINRNEKITLTRKEYREAIAKILESPFSEDEEELLTGGEKAKMQFSLMLNGMVLFQKLEEKLFGEVEK